MKTIHWLTALTLLTTVPDFAVCQDKDKDKPAPADKLCEIEEKKDVPYVEDDDPRHRLDIYLPKGHKDFPVVLLVHGGAWIAGSKETFLGIWSYADVGKALARSGVGVVMPNYRLSPKVKHPEHVRDLARAFAWTKENIGKHGGCCDQLFLAGHSAGGHLVSLLATDEQYLKEVKLSCQDVKGVMSVSGVYRLDAIALKLGDKGATVDVKADPYALAFGDDAKVRKEAAPLTHVKAGLPPFLIVYAVPLDLPTLPEMAKEFAAALKEKKCDVELYPAPFRSHDTVIFNATKPSDPVAAKMLKFVKERTKAERKPEQE